MHFLQLPNEILLEIISNVEECDLNSLVQTNTFLYNTLQTELYRHNIQHNKSKALTWAALHANEKILHRLLEQNADPNTTASINRTSVPPAISSDPGTKISLQLMREISRKNSASITSPLLFASAAGHAKIVETLIQAGADMSQEKRCHRSSIMVAVDRGHADVVEVLLKHGADIEARQARCNTPLRLAAANGWVDVVKVLLRHGADIEASRQGRQMPMHKAADNGHAEVIKALLEAGANVDSEDQNDLTPLGRAARWNHDEAAKVLIEHGSNISHLDDMGRTPLAIAAEAGSEKCVKLLLDHGADVSTKNNLNQTPLCLSVNTGSRETAELLLNHGAEAELHRAPDGNKSVLNMAVESVRLEIVELFMQRGANPLYTGEDKEDTRPALWIAARDSADTLPILLNYGADPNVRHEGSTPLYWAICHNFKWAVTQLLEKGADTEAVMSAPGQTGSAVWWAMQKRRFSIVKLLVEHGANVHISWPGQPLVMFAAGQEDAYLLDILLERGLDANCSYKGKSALFLAVAKGNAKMVRILLKYGANAGQEFEGESLLSWAKRKEYKEIADMLGNVCIS